MRKNHAAVLRPSAVSYEVIRAYVSALIAFIQAILWSRAVTSRFTMLKSNSFAKLFSGFYE